MRRLWWILAFSLIGIAQVTDAPPASGEKVTLMVSGMAKVIYMPVVLADRLGYFVDEGLDVHLLTDEAGMGAQDALLAGAVQGVAGFYDHTLGLQAQGRFVEAVAIFAQAPGEVELVSAQQAAFIHSPADFRGKRLGVTGLGSSTNILTQYLALKHGVRAGEYSIHPVGAGEQFTSALTNHEIDAGMTTEPTASRLLKSGNATMLIDLRNLASTREVLGGAYPASCLYMETSWVIRHKETTRKLVAALVRALHFIAETDAETLLGKLPPEFYLSDRVAYVEAIANLKPIFTKDGRMPIGGPETALAVHSVVNSPDQGNAINLAKTYTEEFVSAVH